jgi:hypothetical protein
MSDGKRETISAVKTPRRDSASDHHVIRELLVHGMAFCMAAAAGLIILRHFYWFFEHNTETPSAAREAFLASVVVIGGIGPAVSMMFLWCRGVILQLHGPQRRSDEQARGSRPGLP